MKKYILFSAVFFLWGSVTAQTLQPFRSANNKWGYKDAAGKIVVAPKYEFEAFPFSDGVAIVRNSGLKGYGVVDASGNEIVPPQYTYAFSFVNGMAKVCTGGKDIYGTNGKWGFIDTKGKVVIPLQYDRIDGNFENDSYASATLNKKQMIIDKTGTVITFPSCDELLGTFYKSNLAVATKGGRYGMVDKTGKVIIPFDYEELFGMSEGLMAAKKNGLWGFIDEKNTWAIQPQFKFGSFFENGFAVMMKDFGEYGCITKNGKVTIPFVYNNMYPQSQIKTPIVVVKKNDKIGLMHPFSGAIIAPIKYEEIADFEEGLAQMVFNKKYGFINTAGKEVIPAIYEYATSFHDGLACVELHDKYGFIDKTGKIVIPFQFELVSEFKGGVAQVNKEGKNYFIDKAGKVVTE